MNEEILVIADDIKAPLPKAFKQGQYDFEEGKSKFSCPYSNIKDKAEWIKGYNYNSSLE
jgi:ribosome modulation factor